MLELIVLVVSVALADSVNPSTVAPALYLATTKDAVRRVATFAAAIFVTNTVAGLLLTFGPARLINHAVPHPGGHAKAELELVTGIALLIVAAVLWIYRERIAGHLDVNEERMQKTTLMLGVGIILVELPTAFPYFAVIAAIEAAGASDVAAVLLLLLFNVLFLLPVFAILGTRILLKEGAVAMLERGRKALLRVAPTFLPAVVLLIGLVLVGLGIAGLA